MKQLLLILTFCLSWLSFSRPASCDGEFRNCRHLSTGTCRQASAPDYCCHSVFSLTTTPLSEYSKDRSNEVASHGRSLKSGRRHYSFAKSLFRFVKSGKTIDRQDMRVFRRLLSKQLSGAFCTDRYIFTLRHLLI